MSGARPISRAGGTRCCGQLFIRTKRSPESAPEGILPRLVALAQEAVSSGRKLMLRIEYRRNTRDVTTGVIRRAEETRH